MGPKKIVSPFEVFVHTRSRAPFLAEIEFAVGTSYGIWLLLGMAVGLRSGEETLSFRGLETYDWIAQLCDRGGSMKKSAMFVLSLVIALCGYSAAQGHGRGKLAQTGLEHAETRANANGQRGIENAEAKQARDRDDSGKKEDKGKSKGKKHGHAKGHSK